MKQHIFFEILKKLSKEELNSFKIFINSPYFNTRKSLVKIFELCLKAIKTGNVELFSIKSISNYIYKGEVSSSHDEKIRRLLSDFTVLLDKFLIQLEFEKNELSQNELLAESLLKRGLESRFKKKISEAIDKLEKSGTRDEKFFLDKISLLQSKSSFEKEFTPNIKSGIDQEINDVIDNFFIASKLYRFQVFYSNQYIHQQKQYSWTFFDHIKTYVEENIETIKKDVPEIFLRYKMLSLLLDPQNKSIIDECVSYIEEVKKDKAFMLDSYYIDILNLCSLMVNSGDSSYNEKIVQISSDMESNRVWDNFHFLSYSVAKIIIESAIIQKEFLWVKSFITYISEKIEPEYKKSFPNLMLAKMYFFSGEYDKARIYQSKVLYKDFIFYTDAKGIEARIEFEIENFSRTIEIIDALKKYLKSHKEIPNRWKLSFSRFGELIIELIKYYEKKDVHVDFEFDSAKKVNEIINSEVYIYGTKWLLRKFKKLARN